MSRLFCLLSFVCLAAVTSTANAGVVVDDFSDGTLSSTSVFDNGSISVSRVVTGNPNHTGNGFFAFQSTFSVAYTVSGGNTFGDLSASFPTLGEFSVFTGTAGVGGDYQLIIDADGSEIYNQVATNGQQIFNDVNQDLTNVNQLTFTMEAPSSGLIQVAGYFGGSFAAVPEPSSLMLAGLGVVGLAGVRRRRK